MLFSLIVSVYNVDKYLPRCLESVLNQSYTNYSDFELIIVDDKSDDNSLSIIEKYKNKFKCKFTLVKKNTNQGLGPSRNSGLEVSNGDYIVFIDGDDFLDIEYLTKLKAVIETKNFPDLVRICYVRETPHFSEKVDTFDAESYSLNEIREKVLRDDFSSQSWLNICKKKLYDQIAFPNIIYEDMPVTFLLYYRAKTVFLLNYYGYHYIQRFDSLSYKPSPKKAYGNYQGFKAKLLFAKEKNLTNSVKILLTKYNEHSLFCIHGLATEPTKENKKLLKKVANEVLLENKIQQNGKLKGKLQLRIASIFPSFYSCICRIILKLKRH